jgi:hypothetical protein
LTILKEGIVFEEIDDPDIIGGDVNIEIPVKLDVPETDKDAQLSEPELTTPAIV